MNGVAATPHNYDFVAETARCPSTSPSARRTSIQITGWVALDKQTHNDGDYGFNIYRRRPTRPDLVPGLVRGHLMTSRIIGEVHMDFIDAAVFSQGLQQSDLWRQASAEMKEFLKPVVKASRELSRKDNIHSPVLARHIVDELRDALRT